MGLSLKSVLTLKSKTTGEALITIIPANFVFSQKNLFQNLALMGSGVSGVGAKGLVFLGW